MNEQLNLERRRFLAQSASGLGLAALSTLFAQDGFAANGRPELPHFTPRAKRAIYLFQSGGPSQMDLFDDKPAMKEYFDKELPDSVRMGQRITTMTSGQKRFPIAPSVFKFQQHGQSGMWLSELLPQLRTIVDDVCFVQGFYSEAFNHDPATLFMNTGAQLAGRPAMGSWFSYGLGSENKDLPAFVVLMTGVGQPLTNASWGSGFLPTVHQGVTMRSQGDPVLFVGNPPGMDSQRRRQSLDALKDLNQVRYDALKDPEIQTRISSYEMAYRMQTSVPEVMDISKEPAKMHEAYATTPGRASFANNCLLARRLVERGVRFVQLYHRGWDHHGGPDGNLVFDLKKRCAETDQPAVALIKDLKERGLLDETLVLWGGEFGRTPMMQGALKPDQIGRDHHPHGYTIWMAGGGIKPGIVHGRTDDFGFYAAENKVHVHDLHATILHLFGIEHTKLTYHFQGRDFRLTDVHGEVVKSILA